LALFALGTAFVLALGARLARRVARGRPDADRLDRSVLGLVVGPLLLGTLAAAPLLWGVRIELNGVARILAAALVAYGILEHHLFGLELQLKRAVLVSFPLILGLALDAALSLVSSVYTSSLPVEQQVAVGLGAVAVGAAVGAPLRRRVADRIFPSVDDSEDYRRRRTSEVYRVALARTVAEGREDDDFLRGLRRDLGLHEEEHARFLDAVRTEQAG
ncbi:MAG: hypothetical protein LC624_08475, partial [Halobacteriales archaeon]|nr:hypothetical protein [Halobacteriales archaeon]